MENLLVILARFLRYKSRLEILVVALLLAAIAGCGGPSSKIVGKWRTGGEANVMVWEFAKNRSISMGDVRGKYSFGDQKRIKIETPFAIAVYRMEFSGDRLILTDPNGSKLEFTKIK